VLMCQNMHNNDSRTTTSMPKYSRMIIDSYLFALHNYHAMNAIVFVLFDMSPLKDSVSGLRIEPLGIM